MSIQELQQASNPDLQKHVADFTQSFQLTLYIHHTYRSSSFTVSPQISLPGF